MAELPCGVVVALLRHLGTGEVAAVNVYRRFVVPGGFSILGLGAAVVGGASVVRGRVVRFSG